MFNKLFLYAIVLFLSLNILAMDKPTTPLQIALIVEQYIIPNRNDIPLTHTENGTLANQFCYINNAITSFSTTAPQPTDILGTLYYDPWPHCIYNLYFIFDKGKYKHICCQGTYQEQHIAISTYLKSLNQIIKNEPQAKMIAIKTDKYHFKVSISNIDTVITQFNTALNDYFYPYQR